MSDFLVQHFQIAINEGQDELIVSTPIPISASKTRVMHGSYGRKMNLVNYELASEDFETRDTANRIEMLPDGRLKIHTNFDRRWNGLCRFSTLSYVGRTGGPNDFSVSRGVAIVAAGVATASIDWGLIFDIEADAAQKAVPKLTGWRISPTEVSNRTLNQEERACMCSIIVQDPDVNTAIELLIITGNSTTVPEIEVGWEITNFTGSNWQISRQHELIPGLRSAGLNLVSVDPATQFTFITTVGTDWRHSWVEVEKCLEDGGGLALGEFGPLIWPTGLNVLTTQLPPGSNPHTVGDAPSLSFAVITNPDIEVVHQGAMLPDGTLGGVYLDTETLEGANGPSRVVPMPAVDDVTDRMVGDPSRCFSILSGFDDNDLAPLGFNDHSAQFVTVEEGTRLRRSIFFGCLRQYIQTIQLPGKDPKLGQRSVIKQPDFSVAVTR